MITFNINIFTGNERITVSDMGDAHGTIADAHAYVQALAGLMLILHGRGTLTRSTLELMGIDADMPAVRVEMTNCGLEWSGE